jgi:hypothetical protein
VTRPRATVSITNSRTAGTDVVLERSVQRGFPAGIGAVPNPVIDGCSRAVNLLNPDIELSLPSGTET